MSIYYFPIAKVPVLAINSVVFILFLFQTCCRFQKSLKRRKKKNWNKAQQCLLLQVKWTYSKPVIQARKPKVEKIISSNRRKKLPLSTLAEEKSKSLQMAPEVIPESSERIKLEGINAGASFSLHQGNGAAPHDCCCINIYINNNIQGANNSLLCESEVNMRDPGVHLFFGDIKMGKRSLGTKRKRKKNRSTSSAYNLGSLFAFVFSILLLLSLFHVV